ncbi:hypothetical protein ACFLTT_01430 [Chloroflexota bacterium]
MRDYNIDSTVLTRKFYQKTLEKALEIFVLLEGIRSIYQFGNISAPGNSDIDLLFVIDDDESVSREIFNSFETKFSNEEKYIIYEHAPLITGKNIIENIHYIRKLGNLVHLYGEQYIFNDIKDKWIKLYQLVELMIQYYPIVYYNNADHPLRWRFQLINAFRFTWNQLLEVLNDFGYKLQYLNEEYIEKVSKLLLENAKRRESIKHDSSDKEFVRQTENALIRIIDLMYSELDQCLIMLFPTITERTIIGNRLFESDYSGKIEVKTINLLIKQFSFISYPAIFTTFFIDELVLEPQIKKAIEKRNQVINQYYYFISNYSLKRSLYTPWWIESNTMKNKIGKLIIQFFGE